MKKLLILLTVLALVATPALAGTNLEKSPARKHAVKHAATRHQKKQIKRKLVRRSARKHKATV
jgi:hypothetical protein